MSVPSVIEVDCSAPAGVNPVVTRPADSGEQAFFTSMQVEQEERLLAMEAQRQKLNTSLAKLAEVQPDLAKLLGPILEHLGVDLTQFGPAYFVAAEDLVDEVASLPANVLGNVDALAKSGVAAVTKK